MTKSNRRPLALLALLALFAAPGQALFAQAIETDDEVNAIIRQLAPIAGQTQNVPHSLVPSDVIVQPRATFTRPAPQVTIVRPAPQVIVAQPPQVVIFEPARSYEFVLEGHRLVLDRALALDLDVFFPIDSALLTDAARRSLHALGRALQSDALVHYKYLIAGHTDASGPDDYNLSLSERRAQSVRDFLVQNYLIDPSRLLWTGFGEAQLRRPDEPYSALNRRVEVAFVASRTVIVE